VRTPGAMPQIALTAGAAVLLALLAVAAPVFADYKDSYARGLTAADRKDWDEAKAQMIKAIEEQPAASRTNVKIYGMRLEPYIPYFHLGAPRYHLGDYQAALRAWETSDSQGALQKGSRWHKELQELRSLARDQVPVAQTGTDLVELARETSRAAGAVEDAQSAAAEVDRLRTDPVLSQAWQAEASLVFRRGQAMENLNAASFALRSGQAKADLGQLREAATKAAIAGAELGEIATRLTAMREELTRVAEREQAEADAAETEAPVRSQAPPAIATPVPEPIRETVPAPSQISSETPESLVDAAMAFVDGKHERVITLLGNPAYGAKRAAAVAHLLRAASRFVLYRRGGGLDDAIRSEAESDVRRCKDLDGSIEPDLDSFPSSFVAFFSTVR